MDNVTEAYRGTKNATDASRRENYFLLISTFKDKNGNTINVPVYIDEHALYNRVFIDTNKISTVFGRDNLREYINKQVRDKNLVRIKRSTQPSESRALIARHYGENASKDSIHQNEPKVNPDDKKISDKRDLTEKPAKTVQESAKKSDKADEAKTKEKGAGAKDAGKAVKKTENSPSPSPDGATSPEGRGEEHSDENTDKAERSEKPDGREKARERAEKLLKWNEEQRPTVRELNDAREYVKGFDNLEISRRLAIIRMIRSAEGKVDKKILKGVANIMAAVPKADIEIRFADGIGGDKGGLYTHIGNKTLLVIDRGTDFKNTIQGTIAHELVHYLENRAGYKEFAEYVMKRVKPEMKAKVTKQYTEYYRGLFTAQFMKGEGDVEGNNQKNNLSGEENIPEEIKARVEAKIASREFQELIESEIVAKYVGKALNNEKLLKKYADKDKKFIARVGGWLARTVTSLKKNKDIDKEAVKVADEMAFKVMVLLQSESVGKSSGTKYDSAIPNQSILSLISNVKSNNFKDDDKVYFENVTDDIADEIKKITGIDVRGFKVAIEARMIKHILERHG